MVTLKVKCRQLGIRVSYLASLLILSGRWFHPIRIQYLLKRYLGSFNKHLRSFKTNHDTQCYYDEQGDPTKNSCWKSDKPIVPMKYINKYIEGRGLHL